MRITVIGCAGSFPGPDGPTSCYLFEAEGFRLVIDLGNGALGPLQRGTDIYAGVDAICLSHQHADHCLDMVCYAVARVLRPEGPAPRLPVYAPAEMRERIVLATGRLPGTLIADAFEFHTLGTGTTEIGPFRVTTRQMSHPVETLGFRVEHANRAFAYSADTGPTEELIKLAAQADLLVCEAAFVDAPDLPEGLHMTARQAGEHAARAGVGGLILTHLVPWNDPVTTLEQAAPAFAGPLSLAVPGLRISP